MTVKSIKGKNCFDGRCKCTHLREFVNSASLVVVVA